LQRYKILLDFLVMFKIEQSKCWNNSQVLINLQDLICKCVFRKFVLSKFSIVYYELFGSPIMIPMKFHSYFCPYLIHVCSLFQLIKSYSFLYFLYYVLISFSDKIFYYQIEEFDLRMSKPQSDIYFRTCKQNSIFKNVL